jgi:hypothetical protein
MKITNTLGLPQPFVDAVSRDYVYTDKRYSVTSLLKGTREAILQRRHDDEVVQDVADSVWMIFGSAVHSILEDGQETDSQLKENKITVPMPNGYTLSGIFDLYDADTKTVTDYKTASVWKVVNNDWDDYRKQLMAYAWMLREIGFECDRGEIVALLKDHSKTKAKTTSDYPNYPVHTVRFKFTDAQINECGEWLVDKFAEIERCEQLPDDELPVCTDEERWATAPKWAVYKVGNKKASRLLDSLEEAEKWAFDNLPKAKTEIVFRLGEDRKCAEYCSVRDFCNYWKENHGNN